MYISDNLRTKLCEKHGIDLEKFVWDKNLNDFLMQIKLNSYEEDFSSKLVLSKMSQVYELGFNIGLCQLTSRYFAVAFPKAKLHYGYLPLLKGTKKCLEGGHVWIEDNGYYIDPTLRIKIPESEAIKLGYTITKTIAPSAARWFSENDIYSKYIVPYLADESKFYEDLLTIE